MWLLLESGSEISLDSNKLLCIKGSDQSSRKYPLQHINNIVLEKGAMMTTDVLLAVANAAIPTTILNKREPNAGVLVTPQKPQGQLAIKQYAFVSNRQRVKQWQRVLVRARICTQKKNLFRWGVDNLLLNEFDGTPSGFTQSLMLLEGRYARLYYQSMQRYIHHSGLAHLSFKGRKRRPAPDPINSLFSLASTLENTLYHQELIKVGLDPSLGFYHSNGYPRQSLIYDLKELTRADIEHWVLALFKEGAFVEDDFEQEGRACFLTRGAKGKFYRAWAVLSKSHRMKIKRITRIARRIVSQTLEEE
ncbi:CRISPR-associated endonuclease Cas1 [Vibrio sp.]|nr:CRISPR-associated endonuclease Cas1 [Vibrio sp.]